MVDALDYVLTRGSTGARLSDIVVELESPLSSTHDLLRSMTKAGLLSVDTDRSYHIGPRFIRLALSAGQSLDVRVIAHAHLEHLAADLNHDVYLAIRLDHAVTYIDRIPGRGRAAVDIRLGDSVPLHSAAAGKLYCAYSPDLEALALGGELPAFTSRTITSPLALQTELESIRSRGYSISNEETITGIVGLAVPVWAAPGQLLAAVHMSAFRDLVPDSDLPSVVAQMKECSDDIARAMGLLVAGKVDQ